MLIARAPMRISYAGGGTDFEAYYREHGGLVVSAAIDRYFFVFVSPESGGSVQVSSSDYRVFLRYDEGIEAAGVGGELKHAEAALRHVGIRAGYSIFMASQIPSGTGLGSSSAVAVALAKALTVLQGRHIEKAELAEMACDIEIGRLEMPIGRQDQYASAFGGVNAIRFSASGVSVEPISMSPETAARLESCTMLFYTGVTHDSSALLRDQQARMTDRGRSNVHHLHVIREAAEEARQALLDGRPDRLGPILRSSWEAKKQLTAGVSSPLIDTAHDAAISAGAMGGKIAGAGGGGFMLVYCLPERQEAVTRSLHDLGMVRVDFHFDRVGARVLMNNVAD